MQSWQPFERCERGHRNRLVLGESGESPSHLAVRQGDVGRRLPRAAGKPRTRPASTLEADPSRAELNPSQDFTTR